MIFKLTDIENNMEESHIGKIDSKLNAHIWDEYEKHWVKVENTNKFTNLGVLLLCFLLNLLLRITSSKKFDCRFYTEKSFNKYLLTEKLRK